MLRLADFLQQSQRVESLKEFQESCLEKGRGGCATNAYPWSGLEIESMRRS